MHFLLRGPFSDVSKKPAGYNYSGFVTICYCQCLAFTLPGRI